MCVPCSAGLVWAMAGVLLVWLYGCYVGRWYEGDVELVDDNLKDFKEATDCKDEEEEGNEVEGGGDGEKDDEVEHSPTSGVGSFSSVEGSFKDLGGDISEDVGEGGDGDCVQE